MLSNRTWASLSSDMTCWKVFSCDCQALMTALFLASVSIVSHRNLPGDMSKNGINFNKYITIILIQI